MNEYTYNLPKELIAHEPADPRDQARLFVYDTKKDEICFDVFANIAKYLPQNSVLVLNDTQVAPSRVTLNKKTGGAVTILFLLNEWDGAAFIKGLPDKGVGVGECLFAGARSVVEVVSHEDEEFTYKLLISKEEFLKLIDTQGKTPLPPYIQSSMDESLRRIRYQTTFAKNEDSSSKSVAAPTASLHFTKEVFDSLKKIHIDTAYVTLHVGRGTFSKVTDAMNTSGTLHSEPVYIPKESAQTIAKAKLANQNIITVGTTALRVVESFGDEIIKGESVKSDTNIFIKPPYSFKIASSLITNFHLPQTSLLMLIDAFLQNKQAKRSWKELYDIAIAEKFRFYSFGDAMLII